MGCQQSITKVHIPSPVGKKLSTKKHNQSKASAKTEKKATFSSIQILEPIFVSRGSISSCTSGTKATISPILSIKKKRFRRKEHNVGSRPLLIKIILSVFNQSKKLKIGNTPPLKNCQSLRAISSNFRKTKRLKILKNPRNAMRKTTR